MGADIQQKRAFLEEETRQIEKQLDNHPEHIMVCYKRRDYVLILTFPPHSHLDVYLHTWSAAIAWEKKMSKFSFLTSFINVTIFWLNWVSLDCRQTTSFYEDIFHHFLTSEMKISVSCTCQPVSRHNHIIVSQMDRQLASIITPGGFFLHSRCK